ncbi:uncharacterized protein LOC132708188 [Cylas formicarius]|uniref:uncharacterized protein LOC132708188 n=1 Tax=Cylas formicarius TaxID=197179 RepID=UPI0029587B66|nr:uncharacterized protein LOC132708188 [Cylas formicarius]
MTTLFIFLTVTFALELIILYVHSLPVDSVARIRVPSEEVISFERAAFHRSARDVEYEDTDSKDATFAGKSNNAPATSKNIKIVLRRDIDDDNNDNDYDDNSDWRNAGSDRDGALSGYMEKDDKFPTVA